MIIDFYILDTEHYQQSLYFTCQLLEKIYQDEHAVYVHLPSHDEALRFDQFLWTYREDSFLPHSLYSKESPSPPLIQIGYEGMEIRPQGTMINLTEKIPSFYHHFDHLIEIVFSSPPVQQLARARYKTYRENGHDIKVHKNTL